MQKPIDCLLTTPIDWKRTPGKFEWSATVDGDPARLTLGNFPDEPLYTVHWRGQKLDIDDAPKGWAIHKKATGPKGPRM